jgi:hypothetical protein
VRTWRLSLGAWWCFASLVTAAVSCAPSTPQTSFVVRDDNRGNDDDEPAPPSPPRDAGAGTPSDDDGAAPPLPDGGKPPGRIYAHSADTLYRFDPLANTVVEVGAFNCVPRGGTGAQNDAVIDIALDRTGQMYGTTYYRFIKIDPTNGSCQVLREVNVSGLFPNSLSFVPIGTVDKTQEALVGYAFDAFDNATVFTRIDLQTGKMTDIQSLNPSPPLNGVTFALSGDFISLQRAQGKTYAALTIPSEEGFPVNDVLAEVNPSTGTVLKIIGDTKQMGFYGLGYWAGKAYGFTASGNIYEIDMTTGASKLALLAKDKSGKPIVWYGAGVTTDSPTAP